PHRAAVGARRPRPSDARQRLRVVEVDADQLAVDALGPNALQRVLADVVLRLILDQALKAHHVEGGVLDRDVGAPVEDAGLRPARLVRRYRAGVVLGAGLHDRVPQLAATRAVEQVDLEARHGGPAGARD